MDHSQPCTRWGCQASSELACQHTCVHKALPLLQSRTTSFHDLHGSMHHCLTPSAPAPFACSLCYCTAEQVQLPSRPVQMPWHLHTVAKAAGWPVRNRIRLSRSLGND
jgi:hypothetical protein